MPRRRREPAREAPAPPAGAERASAPLPMVPSISQYTEVARLPDTSPPPAPRTVPRGVVVFDLDGTILDSIGRICVVAAEVLHEAFGTPEEEGRIHYLATTGMPFEAQLAQLYPNVAAPERAAVAARFHARKVKEAYAQAKPFPEVPRVLNRLSRAGWTLAISTGAEREMADLLLEREGLRYWFEDVLGSGQGTKREHLAEYRRRFPGVPLFLVGDSRFDMEAAVGSPGVTALGRASRLPGWTLTPDDLGRWGARWSDYSLADLPTVLERLARGPKRRAPGKGKGRDRDSPGTGVGPASV